MAALSQALPEPSSTIPMIASGAISGVLHTWFFSKAINQSSNTIGLLSQVLRLPAFVVLISCLLYN